MRLIQAIVWRVICVGLLAAGVAAFYLDLSTAYTVLASRLPDNTALRWSLGVALILVALIGLIPWPKRSRDSRKIAFKGAHGNVSIQLDSVEQTLNRAARKISEAKRINARITPSDNARNVHIQADVTLRKPANVSARDVEAKVSEFIVDQTKRILGEETAVTADLNIVDIVIEDSVVLPAETPDRKEAASAAKSWRHETESPTGTALEALEEDTPAESHGASLPGAALPEPEYDEDEDEEEDVEPASEEDEDSEAGEDEEDKNTLW